MLRRFNHGDFVFRNTLDEFNEFVSSLRCDNKSHAYDGAILEDEVDHDKPYSNLYS